MLASDTEVSEIVVLLLAAGCSSRMGEENKLLLPINGEPMLCVALRAATGSAADAVYLLTGYERARIVAAAQSFAVHEIHNPNFDQGQNTSLAVGLAALYKPGRSVLVLLADQPGVSAALLSELMQAHRGDGGRRALVPTYQGGWGTPRILPPALVQQAAKAGGSLAIRKVLTEHQAAVQLYAVDDAAVREDIDTAADYQQYLS